MRFSPVKRTWREKRPSLRIEQAIYGDHDVGGYRFLARSAGFLDDWLPLAQRLCTGFGERPAGVLCPAAIFSLPFGARHVAVVQVADQGRDDAGRPGALAFRLLAVPKALYADLGGDPFLIADRFQPDWHARGELPALEWEFGVPEKRTVEQVRRVIDVAPERTALLLGGAQVLVDGGRLVFERKEPDSRVIRDLWMLLPTATRTSLWPATFAFANTHRFHVLAVPFAFGPDYVDYVTEPQAGDYPEERYEQALHVAVETGNQAELDALFSRRSRAQVMRLAWVLLAVFALAAFMMRLPVGPPDANRAEKTVEQKQDKPAETAMKLPPEDALPALTAPQRAELAARLQETGRRLGVQLPAGKSERALGQAVVELDRAIDLKKGKDKPKRDPGDLETITPAQRRLRALLWKHGVAEYDEVKLNPNELIERLEKKLARDGIVKEAVSD
jgi:hypothetical protein